MTLARWEQTDPLTMAREMLRFDPRRENGQASFAPSFDVKETEDAFIFHADLPGVKSEDLDLHLADGRLTVSGHRRNESESSNDKYHVYERISGTFSRTFALPRQADTDKVDARLEDGVLTVEVPKRADAKPRKIQINANK